MNEKMMTLTFLKLYTDYKKIRRILFPYSLTNLFKLDDASALSKVH